MIFRIPDDTPNADVWREIIALLSKAKFLRDSDWNSAAEVKVEEARELAKKLGRDAVVPESIAAHARALLPPASD